ncbi:hypothetical protein [Anthocerotibacter panamensis]|nr:hypothetical protein [Anthocerotibacter panamensis]
MAKKRDLRKEKQQRNREYVKKLRRRTTGNSRRGEGLGDGREGGYAASSR